MSPVEETRRPSPAVAGVIVEDGRILLIQRGREPSSGKWSIPGGHLEWGETLEHAVRREVSEETGLQVEVGKLAGVFDLMTEDDEGTEYHYVIVDYFAKRIGGVLTAGDDAADVRWVPIDELPHYELTPHLRERLTDMGVCTSV